MNKHIIDICLSDIPESAKTVAKNGKVYVKLNLVERKQPGNYGETHFVCIAQTKEQREAKAPTIYCGSAKPLNFTPANNQPQFTAISDPNDLPF